MFHTIVILLSIGYYMLVAYWSYKYNANPTYGNMTGYFINGALFGLPAWLWVTRYTKDLVWDGLLFDQVGFISYTLFILYLTGKVMVFSPLQWTGMAMCFAGMLLLKS